MHKGGTARGPARKWRKRVSLYARTNNLRGGKSSGDGEAVEKQSFFVTGEQAEEIYELMLMLSVQCTDLLAKSQFRKEPLRIDLTPIIYLTTAIKKHVEDLKWPGV